MTPAVTKMFLAPVVPVALLVFWFWFYQQNDEANSYITNPIEVWSQVIALRGDLAWNAALSTLRVLAGVGVGVAGGMSAGFALARWEFGRTLFAPTLNVLTAVPVIVLLPFFLIVFGFGEAFRIAVVGATAFLLVYQQVCASVRDLSSSYFEVANIYEKSEYQIVRDVLLPASLPDVVRAARFSLLFSWLAVSLSEKAVAEWPGGGLGYQILRAREQGHPTEMFAAVIVLGFVAYTLDAVLGLLHKRVSHWQDTQENNE